jgi:hypothetical protein
VDFATYRLEMEGPGDIKGELRVNLNEAGDLYFAMTTTTTSNEEVYLDTENEIEWDGLTSLITASLYTETTVKSSPKFLMISTLEIDDVERRADFFLVDVMGTTEQINCTATAWYDVVTGMMTGIDMDFLWESDLLFNAHMFLNAQTESIENPTMLPSAQPTAAPTASPTHVPTAVPTHAPTVKPTAIPTASPTATPTATPTAIPTHTPSSLPSSVPSGIPTMSPVTSRPTVAGETNSPTSSPTTAPTCAPTSSPTYAPSATPTASPTHAPTATPSSTPTASPTSMPTAVPTLAPTATPTYTPTAAPSSTPTASPTSMPTAVPTLAPTATPTYTPTAAPSSAPTFAPTSTPTRTPTLAPTPYTPLQTVITYDTTEVLEGVTAADFDQAARDAFLQVSADSMQGVSVDDLTFISVSNVDNSLNLGIGNSNLRQSSRRLASGASFTFGIKVILEQFGSTYADPDALVGDLESQLATAYADPATSQTWVDLSVAKGSATVTSSTTVTLTTPSFSEPQVTKVKTGAPTMAPTSGAGNRGGSGGDDDSATQTLTIALAVSGAVILIAAVAIAVFFKHRFMSEKAPDDVVISDYSDGTGKTAGRIEKRSPSSSTPGATSVQDDVIMARNPVAERARKQSKSADKSGTSASAGGMGDNEL